VFQKILIANRGEIACRVAATARRLGIRTVAVYSDADARARHVAACDEAVHVGGSAPRESYLRAERILEAARATGAQAMHPGYGFLSENEAFAEACAAAGIAFIGPPASAIAAMGSKSAAKALMERAGVPLVPGYHGADNAPGLLAREAQRIGYPVLIKASAGGGGKGMRRVDSPQDFEAALASCQREAQASFGDAHVLVERYVTRPRHVEIQVFADTHGHAIHLHERDCSVQRRHQKVLEESPAPGLTPERRAEMGAAAVAAAKAVGYVGAGTVEFIAEPTPDGRDLRFYFMEMNTRLQVEHPVTEAVTGLDLVEWQLRVAAGEALPLTQEQVPQRGHAIEARICAENPDAGFLPATGRLAVVRWPAHVAFVRDDAMPRIDTGFGEGDAVSPFYDSMIAKLIVHGATREMALARMAAALRETQLVGVTTNVAFLRRVVASRAFASADLDTALIERERAALFEAPPLPAALAAAAVVAHHAAAEAALETPDPWSRRDGWRLAGSARRRFEMEIHGERLAVIVERRHGGGTSIELAPARAGAGAAVAATRHSLAMRALGDARHEVLLGAPAGEAPEAPPRRELVTVHAAGDRFAVFAEGGTAVVNVIDALAHAGDGAAEGGRLTAPMPGKVVAFLAAAGDRVQKGQALAVIEAMKMEHTITAPKEGVVAELLFAAGDQVADGAELLRLA
jgi:3-methylcrotonyl-CoA carboxylase alpha subunit